MVPCSCANRKWSAVLGQVPGVMEWEDTNTSHSANAVVPRKENRSETKPSGASDRKSSHFSSSPPNQLFTVKYKPKCPQKYKFRLSAASSDSSLSPAFQVVRAPTASSLLSSSHPFMFSLSIFLPFIHPAFPCFTSTTVLVRMARHPAATRHPPGTWHPSEKEVGGLGKELLTLQVHLEKGAGTELMGGFLLPSPILL